MKNKFFTLLIATLFLAFGSYAQKAENSLGMANLPDGYRVAKKAPQALEDIMPWVKVRDTKDCSFRVVLTDQYGDGWNGNTLTVLVNGTEVAGSPFTIESGSGPEEYTFTAETGDMVTTIHAGDSWDYENDWTVYDGASVAIITGNGDGNPTIESDAGVCPVGHNLGVAAVAPSFVISGGSVNPSVTIFNYGAEIETDFEVTLDITDGYSSVFPVTGATLNPGEAMVVTMDDLWAPADGTYSMTATVTVADDNDPTNDTGYGACMVQGIVDAYAGCTTDNTYNEIMLADGALAPVGTLASDPFPMAEEFAEGVIYRVLDGGGFGTVAPDGTFTSLGTLSGFSGTTTGLAYDWNNEIMYAMVLDGSNLPNLCTLDLGTLTLTPVGSASVGMIIAIDFAADGFLYGPALDDDMLYQIDPATGVSTVIGATGVDLNYGQDVSYNPDDELFYTITCGTAYAFGTYDLTTGAFTQIADMGDGQQYGVFSINIEPTFGDTYTVTFNVDNGTDPIEGALVAIDGDVLTTDDLGVATIELEDGDYPYAITNDFCDTYTGTVTVYSATATVNASLTCEEAYLVTFTVTDENSDPIDGAEVDINGETLTTVAGVATIEMTDGTYAYVISYDGCENFEGDAIVDGAPLAVDAQMTQESGILSLNAGITVFPNPSNGIFNVTTDENVTLEVLDITGKVINTLNISGNTQVELDNAGVYFFRFSNENGSAVNRVIVK